MVSGDPRTAPESLAAQTADESGRENNSAGQGGPVAHTRQRQAGAGWQHPRMRAPAQARAFRSIRKRLTDIAVALLVLLLAGPVLLVVMLLVRLVMGSPVMFTQERTGAAGRPFRLLKLRTMSHDRDRAGRPLPDAQRLTTLGRLLRRSSIDELPQMINVLRGDMSLVGPRPLVPRYDPWYDAAERVRFTVRPGITGLAQVNGRNCAGWDDRLALDTRYVTRWSYWLDLRILARTVPVVLFGSGFRHASQITMVDFDAYRGRRRAPVINGHQPRSGVAVLDTKPAPAPQASDLPPVPGTVTWTLLPERGDLLDRPAALSGYGMDALVDPASGRDA